MKSIPPFAVRPYGFTLLELLAVLAVIATLAVISLPSVSDLTRGNEVTRNLTVLSGVLEQARQTAIAKNTFVWVAFSDAPSGSPQDGVTVAVIGATGGVDTFGWNAAATPLANNAELELLAPLQTLKLVKLSDVGAISVKGLPTEDMTNLTALQNVDLQVSIGGRTRQFTRALQFTPTGEARVKAFKRYIEFGLLPVVGNASDAAVLRLAGLTGKTYVYRPN